MRAPGQYRAAPIDQKRMKVDKPGNRLGGRGRGTQGHPALRTRVTGRAKRRPKRQGRAALGRYQTPPRVTGYQGYRQ
jgi:hypothetical protein